MDGWMMFPVLRVLLSQLRGSVPAPGPGSGSHLVPREEQLWEPTGTQGWHFHPASPLRSPADPPNQAAASSTVLQSSAIFQGFFQGSHTLHSPVAAPASLPAPQSPRIICSFTADLTPLAFSDLTLTSPFQLSIYNLFILWNLFHLYLDQHPKSPSAPPGTCCIPFPLEFCSTARVQMCRWWRALGALEFAFGPLCLIATLSPGRWVQTPSPWL